MTLKLALIVVDMQREFEDMSGTRMNMNIVDNVVKVIDSCHHKDIPVFYTQHYDTSGGVLREWWKTDPPIVKESKGWELIPDIAAVVDGKRDTVIEKTRYDGFYETPLKEKLLKIGADTVVICGVMSNLCCETTARTAFVNNFNVIFLRDGNAARKQEYHDATIKNLEYGFATIRTCQEFTDSLK